MTDIDSRINAWHGADIHPEMTSRFLKGEEISSEEYQAMADAAPEPRWNSKDPYDIPHRKETKKERNRAITPVVANKDKIVGAEITGYHSGFKPGDYPEEVTAQDAFVDTLSYLLSLVDKGLLTRDQYEQARKAHETGYDRGAAWNDWIQYEKKKGNL